MNRIRVHIPNPSGSRLVGTIPAFDIDPPSDKTAGDIGGVPVRFDRKGGYGKVVGILVESIHQAEKLRALGFELV